MSDEAIDPRELQLSIREVMDAEAPSDHVHKLYDSGAALDVALVRTAASLGWYALGVGEEQGGLGLGLAGLCVLYEELGRAPATLPMLPTMVVAEAIAASGDAKVQEAWLGRLLAGEVHAAWAHGFNVMLDEGKLSGTLHVVPDGVQAGLFLISMPGGAALVVADAPGLTVTQVGAVDRTRTLATLAFAGVAATPIAVNPDMLDRHAWLGIASDSIGGAASILERTVEYMKVRTQFGQPIGSFQALKHRVANHKLRLEQAAGIVREAVHVGQDDPKAPGLAALAKVMAADAYAAIADDAVQLHGGIGYTWEQDCHIFLKRARLNQMLFGSAEQLLDMSAMCLTEAV
ncbi:MULTISPECIES: acyl-CoA dehydrogenase family protein [unclassified Sphingobium]|uniref:acyl-CoA dehydrogenase family protein n=1 Tax=unclassified Sphingobium TaxID=2611147 RepID=UPI000D177985|nr:MULTISPECIES: acyl-CoA dehydrogenase family protein [unclassified Sphingobium]MBG6120068.1 alkylation response protein AidB-like acyl-CoA dehydrogenase [Sphingobium sp. JAI105]PSO12879.1 acyl-CoA dehydrogenase [Sphingobium sp. AEW4]TWD05731.1 alkylation response protein AidB-like acyl-CoA dehydrogenase [Sphingobium sp. AEW010]TWD23284.1 alkylation response protein AidB-like acyl-CoA dehydrogenase [Sphingobium sp. AEW013]TWD25144.1 alkylation response protein AidB-like acyl-CoA dehydrogenase